MSPTTAALILSWIAIVVLFCAMAGMLRMIRELQAQVSPTPSVRATREGAGLAFAPRSARFSLVVLHSPDCGSCAELEPVFLSFMNTSTADVEYRALSDAPAHDYAGIASVVDPQAFAALTPGYTPAVAVIDRDGSVVDVGPAGDLDALSNFFHTHATRGQEVS